MVNWHKGAWLHSRGAVVGRLYHACFVVLCDIACIVCHTGSMKLPSVCLSRHLAAARCCGRIAAVQWPGDIDRLLHGRRSAADATRVTLSADCRMLNTERRESSLFCVSTRVCADGSTVESYSCYRATVIRSIDTFPGVMLNWTPRRVAASFMHQCALASNLYMTTPIFWCPPPYCIPLSSDRQHLSYCDCLEVKREYCQHCCVLCCVRHWCATVCTQIWAFLKFMFSYRVRLL